MISGAGLGLRPDHYSEILSRKPRAIRWFEAISENYMSEGGRPRRVLEQIRADYPVVLHGVSLSIGSVDPLNLEYLGRLRSLIERIDPAWVSDHLCWTGVAGENLHDLMPLPYTEEALEHLVGRVSQVQEFLGRRILLENVSSYVTFSHSTMSEWEFIAEVARRTGCGLLLDVNNIYVSAVNHGFSPLEFLNGIPVDRVAQMHLAGHSMQGGLLVDTHDAPVPEEVWSLYRHALRRFGAVPTLIERDANIPALDELLAEVARAQTMMEETEIRESVTL